MTPDEMVENAKTALKDKDKKGQTPEEEIESDAESGYFDDD